MGTSSTRKARSVGDSSRPIALDPRRRIRLSNSLIFVSFLFSISVEMNYFTGSFLPLSLAVSRSPLALQLIARTEGATPGPAILESTMSYRLRECPLCGGQHFKPLLRARDYRHGNPDEYGQAQCTRCTLAFLDLMVDEEELAAFCPSNIGLSIWLVQEFGAIGVAIAIAAGAIV